MTIIDRVVKRTASMQGNTVQQLGKRPQPKIAVVTCMDPASVGPAGDPRSA